MASHSRYSIQRDSAAIGRRVGRTMLGIVRPTDRLGLRGGPRRDQSRLDPPYGTLPRSPQPEMRTAAEIVRKTTLLRMREKLIPLPSRIAEAVNVSEPPRHSRPTCAPVCGRRDGRGGSNYWYETGRGAMIVWSDPVGMVESRGSLQPFGQPRRSAFARPLHSINDPATSCGTYTGISPKVADPLVFSQ